MPECITRADVDENGRVAVVFILGLILTHQASAHDVRFGECRRTNLYGNTIYSDAFALEALYGL